MTDMHRSAEKAQVLDLLFEYPDCTVCRRSGGMNTDADSWWCEDCGTSWDRNGEGGMRG